ncbi:MAG: hypothetical protein ACR2QO_12200, partial [Acidimicrobiales bacterium]
GAAQSLRDDDVRDDWHAVNSVPIDDRLTPNRWGPLPLFRRGPRVLSLDIFGYALELAVLEPDDIHRLVASYLRDELGERRASSDDAWLGIRRLAEQRARNAASAHGRTDVIGMPAIREQLVDLLGATSEPADGSRLASSAIRREIQLHGELWQANPAAMQHYQNAIASGVTVAFLADSPLPRDHVSRILQQAGFDQGIVLVSSQEGATKEVGDLYTTLTKRVGEDPDRIIHLGPDAELDHARASAAGIRTTRTGDNRRQMMDQVVAGLVERTGVDSVALGLATDRLVAAGSTPSFSDVGYYAGGPLAAGFCAWAGRMIADSEPDHVLFCGPSSRLLRQVTTLLRPDLMATKMHELDGHVDGGLDPSDFANLVNRVNLENGDRLLTVDLGWQVRPHRWVADQLDRCGKRLDVGGAYIGILDPAPSEPIVTWALTGEPDCPLSEVAGPKLDAVAALLPPLPASSGDPCPGRVEDEVRHELAAGVLQFASDVAPWLAKLPDDSSPALIEPALRLIDAPRSAEVELLSTAGEPWPSAMVLPSDSQQQAISRWRRRPPAKQRPRRPHEDRRL